MKLVAAAKVRRAQAAVLGARPFSENLVKVLYAVNSKLQGEDVDVPLTAVRLVKTVRAPPDSRQPRAGGEERCRRAATATAATQPSPDHVVAEPRCRTSAAPRSRAARPQLPAALWAAGRDATIRR